MEFNIYNEDAPQTDLEGSRIDDQELFDNEYLENELEEL